MRLGKRRFRPTLWPTLAMLVLGALFLRLGYWQWQRAEYKRELMEEYANRALQAPLSVETLLHAGRFSELPRYSHVHGMGRYDADRQLLLQDITHDGVVGYEVLTPFELPGGEQLLVDRGWLAARPDGSAPSVAVGGELRELHAIVSGLPVAGLSLGKAAPAPAGWPKMLFYPQPQDLTAIYGSKLLAPVLKLDPDQPDGYVRETTLDVGFPPERHLAYAFQWAALAVAVFGVWLWVNLKRDNGSKSDG